MKHYEAIGKSDEWYTPKYIFDATDTVFDLDVASPRDLTHVHTPCWFYIHENSLEALWEGFVWMNAPFGGINGLAPWLHKLQEHGNGIGLTPDRSSASWWQNAAKKADAHLQVNRRIKFTAPSGEEGKQPTTGTTLFAFGEQGVAALLNAQKNGLGIVFKRLI